VTPWVLRLILANVALYFLQQTTPAVTDALILVPALVLSRPWTLLTYMFLHGSASHIFFNMLSFWFFGPRLESQLGGRAFLGLYFTSGIMGAVLSFFFAPHSPVLGASGAVFGVLLGYAWFWPHDKMLIWGVLPVEARWMVVAMTLLSLFGGFGYGDGGIAHFAHLGGFAGGYLFLKLLERQRGAARASFRKQGAPPAPRLETAAGAMDRWRKIPREQLHEVNRDELDRILDKISANGIGSLTPGEREFLDRFSSRH
jgi:membrane associated rhomboid family serine protease